jgi:class 3 adenylate cyclase
VRALLFGDIRGFSKLSDEQLPIFATRVLGALAEAVKRHQVDVWHRNTWGDAVFVVLTDAAAAAACALDLQDAMAAIDLAAEGLPEHLALRLGGHIGPVFRAYDPVLESDGFFGSHVSRTARIEPVTPPGTVYVTEAFAAALVLSGHRELTCDYAGHMPAAKNYGHLRMYRLRRARLDDDGR